MGECCEHCQGDLEWVFVQRAKPTINSPGDGWIHVVRRCKDCWRLSISTQTIPLDKNGDQIEIKEGTQ